MLCISEVKGINMKFDFESGSISDVRFQNNIIREYTLENKKLKKNINQKKGIMVRKFVDGLWIYKSIPEFNSFEVNRLLRQQTKNSTIRDYASIVDMCEVNRDIIKFNFAKPSEQDIKELLFEFYEYNEEYLKKCSDFLIKYVEQAEYKEYYSSWGTSIKQEYNHFGIIIDIEIGIDNNLFFDEFNICFNDFKQLKEEVKASNLFIKQFLQYSKNAVDIRTGEYDLILHPKVSGIFVHECSGHFAEADFNDENIKELFKKKLKINNFINIDIVDSGNRGISGALLYDDEGIKKKDVYIVKDSRLNEELTTIMEAHTLKYNNSTGNARAVDYLSKPIPRMTTTYMKAGTYNVNELYEGVKTGIYIKTVKRCNGHFYYSVTPNMAYEIKNGEIIRPVIVPTICGRSLSFLNRITAISDETKIYDSIKNGCGKSGQNNLPVSFGGPHILVNNIPIGY